MFPTEANKPATPQATMTPMQQAIGHYWLSCFGLKVVYIINADGTPGYTWRQIK